MLASLETPYADTRAEALSFQLGLPPLPALAVLPVERAGVRVELRLLGASHQVFAGPVSETVACLPGRPGPLPGGVRTAIGEWSYDFRTEIETYEDDERFGTAVDALCARLAARDDALTGRFPGSPHAVTALALETGPGWRTWHAYPQTREIVVTRTVLEVP